MATFTPVASRSGTSIANLNSSTSCSIKNYTGNLLGDDSYKKKMLREFADVEKKVFNKDIDEKPNSLPIGLGPFPRRPKVELIEDDGNLDALFKQIRQQKYYRESEEREKLMSGTKTRVNIPKAFTEKSNVITDTEPEIVGRGIRDSYDNVRLSSSPTEQGIVLGKEKKADNILQQTMNGSERDIQSKRVSFHASVGATDEKEDTKLNLVSRAASSLDQSTVYHLTSDANLPRNKTGNMFAPSNRPECLVNQQPPEDGLDESCRKLNKLQNQAEVPATYHKLSNGATIDLNNLAPENNGMNSINKPRYFSSTHLYSASTGKSPDVLCKSEVELLPTTKTNFNEKTTPPSIVDQIQSIKLNGSTSTRVQSNDNVAIARFNSKVAGQIFTSAPPDEKAVILDSLSNINLGLNPARSSGKEHTTTKEGKDTSRTISAGYTKFASNKFVTPDSLQSSKATLGKVVSTIPSNFAKDNARSLPQQENRKHIEERNGSLRSSGTANYSTHSKLSQPNNYVLRRTNNSPSTLTMDDDLISSSLKETRALFERNDMGNQSAQGATTIRKVGKLNIRQGFDARSSYAIKERHGEAPSNVSTKMKQQLEDVLQSRSSGQSTPHESRKGSRHEIENYSYKSPRGESSPMVGGLTLIDRINYEMSEGAKQFKRSDSGTSEGSSRGSIKQELEDIFRGRKSSDKQEPVRTPLQKEQKKESVTQLPNAELEKRFSDPFQQKWKDNFINDYQQEADLPSEEERIRPTRDLKAIFEQKKTVSQQIASVSRKVTPRKPVSSTQAFETVQWKTDDSNYKPSTTMNRFQDQELVENRDNESAAYNVNRERKEESQFTGRENFVNREEVKMDRREEVTRDKGVKKLNIPGLFQSSRSSATPTIASRKHATKVETENNRMTVEHQSSYNNPATSLSRPAIDFTNDSTVLMPLHENTLKSTNELPMDEMKDEKKDKDEDSRSTLDDVNQSTMQGNKSKEITPARTVGKLNMHNFSLFGNRAQPHDSAPTSRARSSTNWWDEKSIKRDKSIDDEQPKVRNVEGASDYSKGLSKEETPSATEVSDTGKDLSQVDLSVHSLSFETSPNIVPSQDLLPSGKESKPQSSHCDTIASEQSRETREPFTARRGKLSIPAAFATQKSLEKIPATTKFASTVNKQSAAYRNESKAADPPLIKSGTKNVQDFVAKKDHFSQDSPYFDHLQASEASVVATNPSEKLNAHLINNQTNNLSQGSQQPTKTIPQEQSIYKFGAAKEAQGNFITGTMHLETQHENVFKNSKNGSHNFSEKLDENGAIPFRKVGRLAIPGLFGEVKAKPVKSRPPIKIEVDSEAPSTANLLVEEKVNDLPNGPTEVSNFGHSFQDLPQASSPELLFAKERKESIETSDNGIGMHRESSKEDERGGFISPRRGNFNRNRFIGKISVPSAFQ